jgi:signal transduction histidine kinase
VAALVTLVTLWAFVLVMGPLQSRRLEEVVAAQGRSTAAFAAGELDSELTLRRTSLHSLATSLPPAALRERDQLQAFLQRQVVAFELFEGGLAILKPDGSEVLAATRGSSSITSPDPALAALTLGAETLVGAPALPAGTDLPVVRFYAPLRDAQGIVAAVLVGITMLHPEDLLGVVSRHPLGRSGDVLVVVPQARLVVTGSEPPVSLRTIPAAPDELLARAIEGFTGTALVEGAGGREFLASYVKVGRIDWVVVGRLPAEEAFAPLQEMRTAVLWAASLISLVIGLGVWLMMRRALGPLHRAAGELDAISRGEQPLHPLAVRRPDEVGQLVASFNRLQERIVEEAAGRQRASEAAQAASLAKGRFLAAMSHEIRTPLNGVMGLAELLEGTPLDAEQRSWVATMRQSGQLLLSVLNGILDFSKIEAGRLTLENVGLDLPELVRDVERLFRPLAREKRVALRSEVEPGVPSNVLGDPVRLRQVLANLVSNALKFTAVGEVTIWVRVAGGAGAAARVRFSVQDTGIGMTATDRSKLFQPFSQADSSTTRRFGGTGLGLAISQAIVGAMGSSIEVESAPGKGSIFSFEVVLIPTVRLVQAEPEAHPSVTGRVLLAEDNDVNALVAGEMLRRLGLEVVRVADGRAAVLAAGAGRFDLVLMDLHMPELDGLEATAEIRRAERGPRLPIVALTADVLPEDQARCLAGGMDDFLAKPFRHSDLDSLLRRWLPYLRAA